MYRSDDPDAYDVLEALGEARADSSDPQVWDDEYWDNLDGASVREEIAA